LLEALIKSGKWNVKTTQHAILSVILEVRDGPYQCPKLLVSLEPQYL